LVWDLPISLVSHCMPKGWGLAMLSVGGMLLLLLSVAIVFVGFMMSLVNCQSKMVAYALCNCIWVAESVRNAMYVGDH